MKRKANVKTYYDGSHEDWLYEQVVEKHRLDISELLKENDSWFVMNQISPKRQALLLPFKFEGATLEIGAGCGPLTGALLEKSVKVTVSELSEQRASILAGRYDSDKLDVVTGSIKDLSADAKYDNVVVVGVLEYAGEFFESESPFLDFLKKCKSFLKPGGKLFLAIENKLGVKYLTGCVEDHYGKVFEGVQDYPNYFGRRTFSKKELVGLLTEAGLRFSTFYYPFPDYKFPVEIHTDWSIENLNIENNGFFPTPDLSMPREYLFSEALFFRSLRQAGLASQFTNSFIVEASESDMFEGAEEKLLYAKLSINRTAEKKKVTSIVKDKDKIYALKSVSTGKSQIDSNIVESLSKIFTFPKEVMQDDVTVIIDYIEGERLDGIAFNYLVQHDIESFQRVYERLRNELESVFTDGEIPEYIDLNLSNIISSEGKEYLIDYESILQEPVQVKHILMRSLVDFYFNNFQAIFVLYNEVNNFSDFYKFAFKKELEKDLERSFLKLESKISKAYFGTSDERDSVNQLYPKRENYMDLIRHKEKLIGDINFLGEKSKELVSERERLMEENRKLTEALQVASGNVVKLSSHIENSRALKVTRGIKKIIRRK